MLRVLLIPTLCFLFSLTEAKKKKKEKRVYEGDESVYLLYNSKMDGQIYELARTYPSSYDSYKLSATIEPEEVESLIFVTEFHAAECSWFLMPCGGSLSPILVAEDKHFCEYPYRTIDNDFEPNSLLV